MNSVDISEYELILGLECDFIYISNLNLHNHQGRHKCGNYSGEKWMLLGVVEQIQKQKHN